MLVAEEKPKIEHYFLRKPLALDLTDLNLFWLPASFLFPLNPPFHSKSLQMSFLHQLSLSTAFS